MPLSADQETDFEIVSGKLADVLAEPPLKTVGNFQQLLLLARDEFEDDDVVLELLNKYALVAVSEITKGITRACRRVCKIVNGGGPSTGILVGPNLVLAARHALRGLHTFADPAQLHVFFDEFTFKGDTSHRLECDVARAPDGSHLRVLTFSLELDYVIFYLDSLIGLNRLGSSPRKRRGWMELTTVNVAPEGKVIILQHPEGRLMKVSEGDVNPDTTGVLAGRFHYNAETGIGSSGAPVLNQARQLVGMHVKEVDGIEELISLKAIFADLQQKDIHLPPYPPPKEFTEQFLGMLLEPQSEVAFA
jgi:hypothetical protein